MKLKLIVVAALITTLVAACGSANTPSEEPTPDVAAVRTSAASTVVSQFTLTAAAFTPTTSSSLPTETPCPWSNQYSYSAAPCASDQCRGHHLCLMRQSGICRGCERSRWHKHVPRTGFRQNLESEEYRFMSMGNGYKLVYADYADDMSGQFQPLTQVVQPGQEVELSVQFKAPDADR